MDIINNRGIEWDISEIQDIYHVTPIQNLDNIKVNGLKPMAKHKRLEHEKGIYLVSSLIDSWNIAFQLNKIEKSDYVVLKINKNKIPKENKFYQDLHSMREAGFYTTSEIPSSAITVEEIIPKESLMTKNFIKQKNKKFYNKNI